MKFATVIVAAGRGNRAGGGTPKQWRPLAGSNSAGLAMDAFLSHPDCGPMALVVHDDDLAAGRVPERPGIAVIIGGATRSLSVHAGLLALQGRAAQVLIHDAARPCVTHAVIDGVLAALRTHMAAAPAVAVVDALWTGADGRVTGMADRAGLYRAQTPQGFHLDSIIAAHERFPEGADDDVTLARRAGLEVAITPGDEDNLKITAPADFIRAESILRARHGH
jgi:2-C-methyl-D-erythritol 4-phosphate cytidylyltransferase